MERHHLLGNPLVAQHPQNLSGGRGSSGFAGRGTPDHRHSHVTPPHHRGSTFLRPLSRLLQRLLLPRAVGGWRRFGFRRYLWLLKRHHQRDAQRSGSPSAAAVALAQLGVTSPLAELPLENSSLRRTLQHRGPGWWFRATALRGETSAQQLLRSLLLQQQL